MRSCLALLLLVCFIQPSLAADPPAVQAIKKKKGQFFFLYKGKPRVTYQFENIKGGRPFFYDLLTSCGIKVTRNHPPKKGDDQDHPHHTGIFFTFGDLNGIDFWHLRGRVKFLGFDELIQVRGNTITFAVACEYRSPDGKKQFLREITKHTITLTKTKTIIHYDVHLIGGRDGARIGTKEEGGLAGRVATPLAATSKKGGYLIDNHGRRGGQKVWGKQADWVDYRGRVKGKAVGLLMMTHPKNPNRCWWHARDYGLFAANPFGPLNAKNKKTVLRPGKKLRLRYAVLVHEDLPGKFDAKQAFADTFK